MSLSISSHLYASKDKEEKRINDKSDETRPRTEFNLDPEKHILSVSPDIISDIDSIDEMVVDLDSSHQKRLLAKMEQNRKEILEKTSDDISYYENSDIYSDISRQQPTTATDKFDTSRKDSDLTSDLSSIVELSPAHSDEQLKESSVIKLIPTTVKRVSVSSPAPILLSDTITSAQAHEIGEAPIEPDTAYTFSKNTVSERVDVDDIPEVFGIEDSKSNMSLPQSKFSEHLLFSNITVKNATVESYNEDSDDSFGNLSEISLPGLNDTARRPPTQLSAENKKETLETELSQPTAIKSHVVEVQASLFRPVNIDDHHSREPSNTSQKIVCQEDKLKYEKEIEELKSRIHRIEKENNDMVIHASDKLKQYEYLEHLAKTEMLNYPNKASSIVQHPSTSNISGSPTGSLNNPNNLSIYKQYDDLKKERDAKIENLNARLKEEISKTARFAVLKIQNEEQKKEIACLEEELKDLKAKNIEIVGLLSIAKREALQPKDKQKESIGSNRDLSQIGYVHEQKKKWHNHSRSCSSDLLNQELKKSSSLLAMDLKETSNGCEQEQDIIDFKQKIEQSKVLQAKLEKEKALATDALTHFQSTIQNVTSHLATSYLTFEQKDVIMVELNAIDQDGLVSIKDNLQAILVNIHQSSLQEQTTREKHYAEIEKLNFRISEVETDSLKQLEEFMSEKTSFVAQIGNMKNELIAIITKNEELAYDQTSKDSAIRLLQEKLEIAESKLQTTNMQFENLMNDHELLLKNINQLTETQAEYEQTLARTREDLSNTESQSKQWKKELERQIKSTQALQSTLEESTRTIREVTRKANEHDDLLALNANLQKEIENLNSRIVDMQLGGSVHTEELKNENHKLIDQLQVSLMEQKELNKFIEHENEVNAELSSRLADSLKELTAKDESIQNLKAETARLLESSHNSAHLLQLEKEKFEESYKLHQAFKTSKTDELTELLVDKEALSKKISDLNLELRQSEHQIQELLGTIQSLHESESRALSAENETKQQKNSLESLNKILALDNAKEREETERIKVQLGTSQRELESLQSQKVSLEYDLLAKKDQVQELKVLNERLASEIETLRSEKTRAAYKNKEIDELKNQLSINGEELLKARSDLAKNATESGRNELQTIQSEKFKLECSLKMTEREVFNERNRFQTAELKWQETEHRCSSLERTNQLLEKELRTIRLKYEHVIGEQTKMDLSTQETVMKLQSKIAEQRQIILNLQVMGHENKLLQIQVDQASEKMRPQTLQQNTTEIIFRLVNLESEFQKLKSKHSLVQTDAPVTMANSAELEALKQNMQIELDAKIVGVSDALDKLFQTRREVDREREVNQDIIRINYEKRLEELSKQIRRRHY